MARAHTVYVVLDADNNAVAGFTVKHELVTWLSRHGEPAYHVWRMPDGGHRSPTPMEMPDAEV